MDRFVRNWLMLLGSAAVLGSGTYSSLYYHYKRARTLETYTVESETPDSHSRTLDVIGQKNSGFPELPGFKGADRALWPRLNEEHNTITQPNGNAHSLVNLSSIEEDCRSIKQKFPYYKRDSNYCLNGGGRCYWSSHAKVKLLEDLDDSNFYGGCVGRFKESTISHEASHALNSLQEFNRRDSLENKIVSEGIARCDDAVHSPNPLAAIADIENSIEGGLAGVSKEDIKRGYPQSAQVIISTVLEYQGVGGDRLKFYNLNKETISRIAKESCQQLYPRRLQNKIILRRIK